MQSEEAPRKSPLIKKGTIAYEPAPFLNSELQQKSARPSSEKSVQVVKDHSQDPESSAQEILASAQEKSQKLLAKAKTDAERIVTEAQTRAKKLIDESKMYSQAAEQNAKRDGMAEGQQEGYKVGLNSLAEIIASARDTLRQALEERRHLEKSAESNLAHLAIKIAERVIGSQVTISPDIVLNMVRANLERVKERERVTILVNQHDLEKIRASKELFLKFVPETRSLEIQADPRVDPGGCIVETNLGTVDARISTQLQAIELAFSQLDEQKSDSPEAQTSVEEQRPEEELLPVEEEPDDDQP